MPRNVPAPTQSSSWPTVMVDMVATTTTDLLQLPSARKADLSRRTTVDTVLRWLQTDAHADGVPESPLRAMVWMKSPGIPSHEYIILQFDCTWLRMERDTDNWRSALGTGQKTTRREKIAFSQNFDDLRDPRDQVLAALSVRPGAIDLACLACLLTAIISDVDYYNLYTFNCWWFVGCVWSNLVALITPNGSEFWLGEGRDTAISAAQLYKRSPHIEAECDATTFARIQQHTHLEVLKRVFATGQPGGDMLRISANIEKAYIEALRDLAFEKALLKEVGVRRMSFLVLGPSGVGKTSFIAAVTGKDTLLGNGLAPSTRDINTIRFRERIKFIDTPPNDEFRGNLYDELMASRLIPQRNDEGCTIVLYFHSIHRKRIARDFRKLDQFCKSMQLKQIIFVTAMWDGVSNHAVAQRERELIEFWSSMGLDAVTARFMCTQESGRDVLYKAAKATPRYRLLPASAPSGVTRYDSSVTAVISSPTDQPSGTSDSTDPVPHSNGKHREPQANPSLASFADVVSSEVQEKRSASEAEARKLSLPPVPVTTAENQEHANGASTPRILGFIAETVASRASPNVDKPNGRVI
ncbi:hypothetical protein JAAARDRAFT_197563 [Jaapia argillacea MUCL 33604]|uniref:G domain-containing protein n=1 Tax=Jaapia argillacea MUCL 33604 TaxID=933084 RepID=A0A067PSX5_9AGAM|nr:hypothetical protein JAAARDRAFT_197563 [Jaapia argillacea MUCL 33604]